MEVKGTDWLVCATAKCKLTCEWDCSKTAEAWNLVIGIVLYFFFPWVGKLCNEYGLELLLPHSRGRGACGSLCIRSAKLAVEAVVEFWHCLLDFHQPHFLQEVCGVRETCGETCHGDLQVWKATSSACGLLSEDKDREGLETMQYLLFFSSVQTVGISSREAFQCVWCSGTADLI